MIVHRGHLYAIADAGILYCWKADTGEEKWKGRLGGTFSASLALADGKLYAANEAGEFFVAEASPKQFKILSKNNLGDEILPPPSFAENDSSSGRLTARDPSGKSSSTASEKNRRATTFLDGKVD